MRRALIAAALFAVAASLAPATPLIGRGAGTLKPMQFIAELDLGYAQTTKTYDWTAKEWKDLDDKKKTTTISGMFLAGLAPLKNWEVLLMAPLASRSQDTLSSMGVGDVELHTRYALIAGKLVPVKLTAVGAFGLPTASKDAKPKIGDGKMAGGLGLIAMTKSFSKMAAHLRLAYWLNGSVNDTTKVGDMFEYVAKFDYDPSKSLQFWLSLAGTMQGKTKYNGTAKDNTQQDRHIAQLGAVYKPIPMLSIRPKAGLPLAFLSKGGALAPFSLGLDFWVIAP